MVEMLDDNIVVSDTADATETATQPYQPWSEDDECILLA
jgi:hypothetical protein